MLLRELVLTCKQRKTLRIDRDCEPSPEKLNLNLFLGFGLLTHHIRETPGRI